MPRLCSLTLVLLVALTACQSSSPVQAPTSLGMHIMRERAEAIGADLHISSSPGAGTCIEMIWNTEQN